MSTTQKPASPPRYVYDAVRLAGEKFAELDEQQRARALSAEVQKPTLRGKALGAWILDGKGLREQSNDAAEQRALAAAEAKRAKASERAKAAGTTTPAARGARAKYPVELLVASRRAREIRGYGPGPKQHQDMRRVLAGLVQGEVSSGKLLALLAPEGGNRPSAAQVFAVAAKEAPLGSLPGLKPLGKQMGPDAWCKGGHLAAAIAAWLDELNGAPEYRALLADVAGTVEGTSA